MARQHLVMLGTHFDTMGGISSVVNVYRDSGLFDRQAIRYLATHRDGGRATKLLAMASAYVRFVLALMRGKVGAVHAHVASRASFWRKAPLLRLAQWRGVPTVVHLHGAEFHLFYENECSPGQQAVVREVFEQASAVIALSGSWKSWIERSFPAAKVSVIPNPIAIPAPTDWSQRLPGVVLSLGRIGERKGSYDLLTALAATPPAQRWSLRLGGDGELEQFKAKAQAQGLADQVQLLGWVRGDDKARQLREAWIYTLPSYNEGLPMSVLEAMAAGLPIVSTPIGGIPDAVTDGVEGFLVTPGDTAALGDRLGRLCADPELARRMGAAARARAIHSFSIEAIGPQLEAVYARMGWAPAATPPSR